MALTLTQAELSAAIRLGNSTEEIAEATRLLAFTTEAISRHLGAAYASAPAVIVNEAAIRLAAYLFDSPNAGRGLSFANAGRNSGAWQILLPYRVHRAGSTGEVVAAAQEAVGTPGNQVTGVVVDSGYLVVTLADGSITRQALPGMGGSEDQTARDAAAQAQSTADGATTAAAAAQADLDAHEANHPSGGAGVDQTARDAAAAAQGTANNAATAATAAADTANANTGRLDAFPAGTGGVDQTARDAADGAQGTADGAQTAAAAAQGAIAAHERAAHNTDATARDAAAAAQAAADAAQAGLDAHERAPHNTDGTARTAAAAAAATAATAQTTASTARDAAAAAQADADTAQTTAGQAQATATAASAAANAAQSDIDDHKANHPTGMGGGPTVLYEAATAAIGGSTGLIAGNVGCPETGALEFYFQGLTGTRQGGVAYARIPVARIRGAVSALDAAYSNDNVNLLAIPHGANRGIGIAVQATTNFLMLSAQAPGNFYIRIRHASA